MAENTREANLAKLRAMGQAVRAGSNFTTDLEIDYTSEFGEHYTGTVTVHKPNMGETLKIGVLRGQILKQSMGDDMVPLDLIPTEIQFFAMIVATLKVVVDKCPDWLLNPEEVMEADLLAHVYKKVQDWQNSFRKSSGAEPDGDSEASR
jgi:hypothetical protein